MARSYTPARCARVSCSSPDSCAMWAVMSWGAESKLYNFVQWGIQKLEAVTPELTDEDEEDNYQVQGLGSRFQGQCC